MPFLRQDPTLLAAFRAGKRDALERVYRLYARSAELYVRALVARSGQHDLSGAVTVADLIQEVFVRAFSPSARNSYDGLRDYGPYLTTIARNCLVDILRARGREVPTSPDDLTMFTDDTAVESASAYDAKTLGVLNHFLAELPSGLRGVYEQRFVMGRSQVDASTALGQSRRNIRTAEDRLRRGLRKALAQAGISLRELGASPVDFSTRRTPSPVASRSRS